MFLPDMHKSPDIQSQARPGLSEALQSIRLPWTRLGIRWPTEIRLANKMHACASISVRILQMAHSA